MKRFNRKRQGSLVSVTLRILVPALVVLVLLFLVTFRWMINARELAYKYMLDTAELYIEKMNSDLEKITSEVYALYTEAGYYERLPDEIVPTTAKYYDLFQEITEKNKTLKLRYGEEYKFYVYSKKADFLILNESKYFKNGNQSTLSEAMRETLQQAQENGWQYVYADDTWYLVSAFIKEEVVVGCYIDLNSLLEPLVLNNMGYEAIPYIEQEDGILITAEGEWDEAELEQLVQQAERQNNELSGYISYDFMLGNHFQISLVMMPTDGVLDGMFQKQLVVIGIAICFVFIIAFGGSYYYRRILSPMKRFVSELQNPHEEQLLNDGENYSITELEMASAEFREMLRKIRSLKIAVYEQELLTQKTQLEYAQEQVRPHFYLNCLSIVYGMAEKKQDQDIMHIVEVLSRYMRYVINDSFVLRRVRDELAHIQDYIEIQKLRYRDAFVFEADVEEAILEYEIPALVLQVFVENAVKHAVSLDKQIEISLYMTTEVLDGEEYLYVTVSDTGEGFSEEILEALEKGETICYDGRKHVGIQNTQERLRILYGNKASVKLSNMGEGYGAVVELTMPLIRKEMPVCRMDER